MAYNARKTEHAGPKKRAGAYYGRKSIAKKASNRRRRENDKHEISTHGEIIGVKSLPLTLGGSY
jgi:hypothetical protein